LESHELLAQLFSKIEREDVIKALPKLSAMGASFAGAFENNKMIG
jgi:hypothetical protein